MKRHAENWHVHILFFHLQSNHITINIHSLQTRKYKLEEIINFVPVSYPHRPRILPWVCHSCLFHTAQSMFFSL